LLYANMMYYRIGVGHRCGYARMFLPDDQTPFVIRVLPFGTHPSPTLHIQSSDLEPHVDAAELMYESSGSRNSE